jgi:hypothetical protein
MLNRLLLLLIFLVYETLIVLSLCKLVSCIDLLLLLFLERRQPMLDFKLIKPRTATAKEHLTDHGPICKKTKKEATIEA